MKYITGYLLAQILFLMGATCSGDTLIVTNVFSFGVSPNASGPRDTPTLYTNGFLYSTTPGGGPMGNGTIYKITTNGIFSTIFYFSYTNGCIPKGGLVIGNDGNLYGTTSSGGAPNSADDNCGTVFQATISGGFISLATFNGQNGYSPLGRLIQASDSLFYGTTYLGGDGYHQTSYPYTMGSGTVFSITTNGVLNRLFSFSSTNGANPCGALLEVTNGLFYGTTSSGGSSGAGTIFQITSGGTLTTLVNFNGANGSGPQAGLIRGLDGCFYGTTLGGGLNGNGTIFRLSRDGTLKTLYSFSGQQYDGANPYDELFQGSDGCLYGTTCNGGAYNLGVVFQASTVGGAITLYSFHYDYALPRDGGQPYGGLLQLCDGYFYGTAEGGGDNGGGTFFRFPIPPTPNITEQSNKSMKLKWCSVVGGQYQLQYITNLVSTNWMNIGGIITATNVIVETKDSATSNLQRYYRVTLSQ
jgi:uncharacterized repeat protein (TIGR03803 family)